MRFKKKVYRQVVPSKSESPGSERRLVDFGYVIIPNDIPRDAYINNVYRTSLAMIITSYNEVIKDVMIPRNIIKEITFPQNPGEYGSLVGLICYKEINQMFISHLFNKSGEMYGYQEGVVADQYTTHLNGNVISIIKNVNNPSYSVSVTGEDDNAGTIIFSCKSSRGISRFVIDGEGHVHVYGDKDVTIKSADTVKVEGENISIDGNVVLGGKESTNPILLGNEVVETLTRIIAHISTLASTLQLTPIVSDLTTIQSELSKIKSDKVFTK